MQNILFYLKKYGKDFLFLILVIVMLGILIYSTFIKKNEEDSFDNSLSLNTIENTNIDNKETIKDEELKFFVDIKGAVKAPGVYEVSNINILNDVINLAGGFKSDAYKDNINLSKKVKAEMVIYVYTKSEIKKYQAENNKLIKNDEVCETPDYNIWECVEEKQSIIEVNPDSSHILPSTDKDSTNKENTKVNINTANESELSSINGFGPSKANAIIEYRNKNGNFSKIEDLMNVSGIGEKTFEKIKDSITV